MQLILLPANILIRQVFAVIFFENVSLCHHKHYVLTCFLPGFLLNVIVNNAKFCISYGSSSLPGNVCGGILGNADPINATVGTCPSSDAIKNALLNSQADKLSWLCCNNE